MDEKLRSEAAKKKQLPVREMLMLAEQSREGNVKVLPGKEWAFHYVADAAVRVEKLQGLLEGRYKPEEVAGLLRPDALTYNVHDIATLGLQAVSTKIFDLTSSVAYFDHKRFAEFIAGMKGRDVSLETLEDLYKGVSRIRTKKKLRDSYGLTGKRQIDAAFKDEVDTITANFPSLSREQKVLSALKFDWLCEKLGQVSSMERDKIVAQLSGAERELYKELSEAFRQYVDSGDEKAYKKLTESLKEQLPKITAKPTEAPSESMKELENELEPLMDQVGPPGGAGDPGLSPEDQDEYQTPPNFPGGGEKLEEQALFEIQPPLSGYYAGGKKSYYDIDRKTWSKKKQLHDYTSSTLGQDQHTISGTYAQGLRALPIPTSYALDINSLKCSGVGIKIMRDQNGCFYFESSGSGTFSIDFAKEQTPFNSPVVTEDRKLIHRGFLSTSTENMLKQLVGNPAQVAEQLRQYMLANHYYPGGGDLQAAQALQLKLRNESTGDTYIQNLEVSEYLECYSANTLFIAMLRKAGIPARLVLGHHVDKAKDKKSVISGATGHAWSEFFDGTQWRRIDATPRPKPEDKKDDEENEESSDQADQAEDGGQDNPSEQEGQEPQDGEPGDGESQSGNQTGEASDSDIANSEKGFEQAKEKLEKINQERNQIEEKVSEAKSFEELAKAKEELEKSELFDDMKDSLEEKLEAKEEEMKQKIKDRLDKMVEDGFMDEKKREEFEKKLEKEGLDKLDELGKEIERESSLYEAYDAIRERVQPLVDKWFQYFVDRLPKEESVETDEDSLTRQGSFNRRSVNRARNLIFGTIKNPRMILPSFKPRFMASIMVDVSGSMQGPKLENARALLVFYSELFSRINKEFKYLRFSINVFSDSMSEIKAFNQEYDSPARYNFGGGKLQTVKMRLMEAVQVAGGTNMLDPIKKVAKDLTEETFSYPDFASAFYFIGDGEDTNGNSDNVRQFMELEDQELGFGNHMRSAIMLGDQTQRQTLAQIFGDEHTTVAPDFDSLIEESMNKFEDDIEFYLKSKTQ